MTVTQDLPQEEKESLRQPVWHVFVLSILTCFAYPIYWFYKTWRDVSAQEEQQGAYGPQALSAFHHISPLLRTIGLFVPVFNIYLSLTLFKGIAELHPNADSYPRKHPLIASGCLTALFIALVSLRLLPGSLFLLCFSAALPLAIAQWWLNEYWKSAEPEPLPVRYAFTLKELAAIVIGGALLGLVVTSFFLPGGAGGGN